MKRKFIWIFSGVMVLILLLGINNQTGGFGGEQMLKPKKHNLLITKIGDEWKVVLEDDSTKKKVKANRKDKIRWKVEGSDVYFQFMEENLFGKYKDKLKKKAELTLEITDSARLGNHKYAVFCLADSQYATGGSPPEIDITD